MTLRILVIAAVTCLSPSWTGNPRAFAQDAVLTLHIVKKESFRGCSLDPVPPCRDQVADAVVRAPLGEDYAVYILLADWDVKAGLAAVQFGVSYDGVLGRGVDITEWVPCGDSESPDESWPAPGSVRCTGRNVDLTPPNREAPFESWGTFEWTLIQRGCLQSPVGDLVTSPNATAMAHDSTGQGAGPISEAQATVALIRAVALS